MEVALIICCFVSNALALECLYSDRRKTTGALIIVNLCLNVAIAYQFKQIQKICYILMIVAAVIILFFGVKYYLRFKSQKEVIVETKEIETDEDNEI